MFVTLHTPATMFVTLHTPALSCKQ